MSLTSALSSAITGLSTASKRAATVSSNVTGAGQDGYARRSLEVTPISPYVTGVRTDVVRHEDAATTAIRREAGGDVAGAGVRAGFWADIDTSLGDPGDPDALSTHLARLEAALVDASAQPGSPQRLAAVLEAADGVAAKVASASDAVQAARQGAEDAIVKEVGALNDNLEQIARLNTQIARVRAGSGDAATLEDQRGVLLTQVAETVGIHVLKRDFGAVAIVSKGGAVLIDGRAYEVEFTPAVQVTADRFLGTGLNALTMEGRPLNGTGGAGSLGGGRLGALFALRDTDAPAAQGQVDAMAAELMDRFAEPAVPPAAARSLFVDADPLAGPDGLASRLAIDPAVAPSNPAGHWRLRDGLSAAAPDPAAPAGRLPVMLDAFTIRAAPVDPALGTGTRDLVGIAADLKSALSFAHGQSETVLGRAQAGAAAARERDAISGVDIDEEMRRLIEIEQSYAAAARVVEAVDEMMDRLTRI